MRISAGRIFYLLICLFFTAIFIWLFVRGGNWQEVILATKNTRIIYLALAILALVPMFYIRLWRWTYILQKHHSATTRGKCLIPFLSSCAINNLLPFRLGDAARITLFNKQLDANYATIASSLLIERMVDFFSLLIIFCTGFLCLGATRINSQLVNYIFIVCSIATICMGTFLGFSSLVTRLLQSLHTQCLYRHMSLTSKAVNFVRETADHIYVHNTRKSMTILLAASLSIWLAEAAVFWLVAQSLGMTMAATENFYVMSVSAFSSLLPGTPGNIGTFHYLCRTAMEQTGATLNNAIAFSILVHMVIIIPVTIIGSIAFTHYFGNAWKNKIHDSLQKNHPPG